MLVAHTDQHEGRETIRFETIPRDPEIVGQLWSNAVDLNGRPSLVSANHTQLRIWDLQEVMATLQKTSVEEISGKFAFGRKSLTSIAADENVVAVGDSDGTIWLWNNTGELVWSRKISDEGIQSVAIAGVGGTQWIVAGVEHGFLYQINISDGSDLCSPIDTGPEIWALAIHKFKGGPAAFVGVNVKNRSGQSQYVVRVWNLVSGNEIDTVIPNDSEHRRLYEQAILDAHDGSKAWALQSLGYYKTKPHWCLAVTERNNRTWVLLAGPHGEVRAIELESFEELDHWSSLEDGVYVHSVAIGDCGGRPLAFAGSAKGTLFVRDLDEQPFTPRSVSSAHRGLITALVIHSTLRGECLVSAGIDGLVNFWTPNLVLLHHIEINAEIRGLSIIGHNRLAVTTKRGLVMLRLDWEKIIPN
jgi:WD40 repeat protein